MKFARRSPPSPPLARVSRDDPLLKVALELEHIALEDDYFIEKKLYPNVDFYSGITLRALGFPISMFTVLFAVARTVGWIAQWNEMIEDPDQRIGRPRQIYVGPKKRDIPEGVFGWLRSSTGVNAPTASCVLRSREHHDTNKMV